MEQIIQRNEQQKLQKGILYPWDMQQYFSDSLQQINGQIIYGNQLLSEKMDEVANVVTKATRKKRHSITDRWIVPVSDGTIVLIKTFDDEGYETVPFFLNVRGEWQVFKLRTEENGPELFAILFRNPDCWVVGWRDKVSGRYLYERFVKSGVRISASLSTNGVQQALFRSFAHQIDATPNEIQINPLAGWQNEKFFRKENFPFMFLKDFISCPVMSKSFSQTRVDKVIRGEYFRRLRTICRWQDRLLIALMPFAGILASVLKKEGMLVNWFLNFVPYTCFPIDKLCDWMQIFNRESLAPITLDMTQKKMTKKLENIKDEVLICDFLAHGEDGAYEKRKRAKRTNFVGDMATGKCYFSGREKNSHTFVLVTITDRLLTRADVHNVLLDDEFMMSKDDETIQPEVFSAVFADFVSYVEQNYLAVISMCRKYKHENKKEKTLNVILQIVRAFWEEQNVDFLEAVDLQESIDLEGVFQRNFVELDDLVPLFVDLVRKNAKNYVFLERGGKADTINGKRIVYDSKYVWIPAEVLYEILDGSKVADRVTAMWLELRDVGQLKTDAKGFKCMRNFSGELLEYYQIKKDLFQKPGYQDICLLGKEED